MRKTTKRIRTSSIASRFESLGRHRGLFVGIDLHRDVMQIEVQTRGADEVDEVDQLGHDAARLGEVAAGRQPVEVEAVLGHESIPGRGGWIRARFEGTELVAPFRASRVRRPR